MDENDEIFLAKAIENKATAHDRRKDSLLYLNHRVKKKDILKLVNYNRGKRSLALLKSVTAVYNRSRPKNIRSTEARCHIGLGLFCCRKPPKAEDSNNLLTDFCRAHKKNIIRKLCENGNKSANVLFRSFDDKAYLCPNTSTGMQSARNQRIFQPADELEARKFLKYDFPLSMLNCTPGTFLYMTKSISLNNEEVVITTDMKESRVVIKPKYFIGSSGSVWSSHCMLLRHEEPLPHLKEGLLPWQTTKYLSIVLKSIDCFRYFVGQSLNTDLLNVQNLKECVFRSYEKEKLNFLRKIIAVILDNFTESKEEFHDIAKKKLENLESSFITIDGNASNLEKILNDCSFESDRLLHFTDILVSSINQFLDGLQIYQLPKMKSRIVDLTDAGPGVGITNYEVQYRMAQELILLNVDYYVRHHLAPGDSSQNEVERIQSYVGKIIM